MNTENTENTKVQTRQLTPRHPNGKVNEISHATITVALNENNLTALRSLLLTDTSGA